jgi:GTP-binding protein EngB required for normal cell division
MERRDITPIGVTNYRNTNQKFGIKDKDRLGHIYVIGKTDVGKSTLLQNMAISDIERGNG